MDLSLFDYPLPQERIAQHPAPRRDASRLLVVHRSTGTMEERGFQEIGRFVHPGDVLVINDTFVIPARLLGRKVPHGAAIEILLLEKCSPTNWIGIASRAVRLKKGTVVSFSPSFSCEVQESLGDGKFEIKFSWEGSWYEALKRHGQIPLPPYIDRGNGEWEAEDRERYQTIFAVNQEPLNSAAAPTAGLHFTPEILARLHEQGVILCPVTLRIGLDTFLPLRVDRVEEHRMHSEAYTVPPATAQAVRDARSRGNRVIAVGTTAVRVLESAGDESGGLQPGEGVTRLFIYPGYRFRTVDALLTNFHLPRSTLLLLVSAFMGNSLRTQAYDYAVQHDFRFYSYGDAMFIE